MNMILGVGAIFGLFAVLGSILFLSGGSSKITSIFGGLGIGTGGGILSIFSDVYKYILACFSGELGLVGYLFIGSILFLFGVFAFNMIVTATDKKKGNFSFFR